MSTLPGGTLRSVYRPSALVTVNIEVPTRMTRVSDNGSDVSRADTLPVMLAAAWGCCAVAEADSPPTSNATTSLGAHRTARTSSLIVTSPSVWGTSTTGCRPENTPGVAQQDGRAAARPGH